jgi:hypothetical protein
MYVSRDGPAGGVPLDADVAKVADEVTREGRRVRLVRSIIVPEEETCFYLFQAQTADDVREAARRAGLRFERVVEAVSDWNTADIRPLQVQQKEK